MYARFGNYSILNPLGPTHTASLQLCVTIVSSLFTIWQLCATIVSSVGRPVTIVSESPIRAWYQASIGDSDTIVAVWVAVLVTIR